MARESTIQILRSTTTDVPTGLTFGELAYSDVNEKLFVGDLSGNSIWIGAQVTSGSLATNSSILIPTQSAVKSYVDGVVGGGGSVVNSVNGTAGTITITGDGGSQQVIVSGATTTLTNKLASTTATGVASFNSSDFTVTNGAVSIATTKTVVEVYDGFNSKNTYNFGDSIYLTGSSGLKVTNTGKGGGFSFINMGVVSVCGLTGAVCVTGDGFGLTSGAIFGAGNGIITARLATIAATGVASFDPRFFAVGSSGHVSLTGTYQATGNTVASGGGSQLVSISGNIATIDNRVASISVTGVASFDPRHFAIGSSGHVSLTGTYQATGDTVAAGGGIVATRSGNTVTVANSGVTAFNGLTGAISLTGEAGGAVSVRGNNTISVRVADASTTGVASFNPSHFTVSSGGGVSLNSASVSILGSTGSSTPLALGGTLTITGASGSNLQFVAVGNSTNATVTVTNLAVLSVNGLTGAITITGDGGAQVVIGNNTFTNRIASISLTGVASFDPRHFAIGSSGHVSLTGTYQVTGQTVVSGGASQLATVSGNTVTIDNRIAGLTVTGVASFDTRHFAIGSSGHVSLTGTYQATGQTVVSGGASQLTTVSGNTVTIDNRIAGLTVTGVASFDTRHFAVGSSGHVSLTGTYQATGDTVAAGGGIVVTRSGNTATVANSGVTSFNGLTGTVSMTGDGQAIVGAGNNTIRARLAGVGVTGVASFNTASFSVDAAGDVTIKSGGVSNAQLANSTITIKAGSGDAGAAIALGSSFSITGTPNQVSVSRSSTEYTLGLPNDITIPGNLTVNGTVVTANVDTFVVEDPLFMLGTGNSADSLDLGFYGRYVSSGTKYAGVFRDASDSGKFKFFVGLTAEPTTFVDNSYPSYGVATIVAKVDGGTF